MKWRIEKINRGIVILYGMLILTCIIVFKHKLIIKINELTYEPTVQLNLTTEQKQDDFETFYNTIIESCPLLDVQKELYGIDFKERREYYLELISATKDDFEFFCTLSAIEEDIPSFHTDLCFPMYSNYLGLNCYNLKNVLVRKDLKSLSDYWYQCIEKNCEKLSEREIINFCYVEGTYVFDPLETTSVYSGLENYRLVAINDEPMESYVVNHISTYKLYFDFVRNKPYRAYFTFNDKEGEAVEVTLQTTSGAIEKRQLYYDFKSEIYRSYGYLFKGQSQKSSQSVSSYLDKENKIGYLAINNFSNNEGETIKDAIDEMQGLDAIIIDLRKNYGGQKTYAMTYLYPNLYNINLSKEYKWYVPISEANKIVNNNVFNKLFYLKEKEGEGNTYRRKDSYKGGKGVGETQIYYLIGNRTASAADTYAAFVKENNLGTLVGNSTSGEGLGDSFCVNTLPYSGLTYIYTPNTANDEEGNNNSTHGTTPDISMEQSIEDFYRQRENQEETITYEEQLKYDTVLRELVEMIRIIY